MVDLSPDLPQNLFPSEPELKDVFTLFKKDVMLGLNCHAVGVVQSFNSDNQTANATVNYKKVYRLPDSSGVYVQKTVAYPQLIDCPVVFLGGGEGALTFPVAAGDECLILFNDRDLDNWFEGNYNAPPATPRLHSFSDAVILVGLRSRPHALDDFNEDGTELRYGTTKVIVAADSLTATVEGGTTLQIDSAGKITVTNLSGEFVASLIDMLTTAFTNTMLGPQTLNFDPALLAIVESFKA